MQVYQRFWQESYPSNQMVSDWDTFISNFSKVVRDSASIKLIEVQEEYLKAKIDPSNTNQIYKSGYMLFVRDFWGLPSNRSKFFSMKLNLSDVLTRSKIIEESQDQILISLKWTDQEGQIQQAKYILNPHKIKKITNHETIIKKNKQQIEKYDVQFEKRVNLSEFFTIGYSEQNDIQVNSIYINQKHIKIIHQNQFKQQKSILDFNRNKDTSSPWYIRDISKSSRLIYCLNDNHLQFLVVKKDMVLKLGATNQFQLRIQQANEPKQSSLKAINEIFNEDRFDYMGNDTLPLKKLVQLNGQSITTEVTLQMYEDQLYYPNKKKQTIAKKYGQSNQDDFDPIKISIKNIKTNKKWEFDSKNLLRFTIGRTINNHLQIDSITMRDQELMFEYYNQVWVMRSPYLRVFLANRLQIEECRVSNRFNLWNQRAEIFQTGSLILTTKVINKLQEQQQ